MKNFRWTLLAALLLAAPQVAHAQPPGFNGPGRPATTTTTTTQDAGAITNAAAAAPAGSTTTSTTVTTGISPDTQAVVPDAATGSETETVTPDTGGSPILMSLTGIALATAAFGLRRKVTA